MRFSLRDLFWLIFVVSLGCGFWRYHEEKMSQYRKLDPLIIKLDLPTLADYINDKGGVYNLHMLDIKFSNYYGSTAEMRFKYGETLPAIKKFKMANGLPGAGAGLVEDKWQVNFTETNESTGPYTGMYGGKNDTVLKAKYEKE
jgi:hypothetical protein